MNDNSPFVSVVVPTYNVEPYLIQCLDSLNAQTYENFECIIIIDGATDRSFEISKDYCFTHPKFKVFFQDNAGSGPARNNGIAHSIGEFICFIDPDDWVTPNYIESLVVEQKKGDYDLVISQSVNRKINSHNQVVGTRKNTKSIVKLNSQQDCRDKFPMIMFEQHLLDGPICKLFKTAIIKENNIEFPAYRRSQDMVFNFRYYNFIKSISVIPDYTYNVRCEFPPLPNRGRIFVGYNEVVIKIYKELSKQIESWNLKSDYDIQFHSWSFWYLYGCITMSVLDNVPYNYIKDEPYKTIINKARPKFWHQKPIHFCLKHGYYAIANLFIRVIEKLKNR